MVRNLSAGLALTRLSSLQPRPAGEVVSEHDRPRRRQFSNELLVRKFEQYLTAINQSANTRTSYLFTAKRFSGFLEDKPLTAATKNDVRAFLGSLHDRNLAAGTIRNALHGLRSFYNYLQLGDQVRTSVPRFIQTPKLPRRLPHALSEDEIQRIIAAAEIPRDRALIELAYASGLRVSELAHLRVEDVNLRGRTLTVRRGKGNKDRRGFFGDHATEALRTYVGDRTHGFVFLPEPRCQRGGVFMDPHHVWWGQWRATDTGGRRVMRSVRLGDCEIAMKEQAREVLDRILAGKLPPPPETNADRHISTKSLWRIVAKAAKRAGIPGVHPHIFRHSCATHCLNHGMDIRFVQELLGHENLSTTAKYLHVALANLQATHEKFHPRG